VAWPRKRDKFVEENGKTRRIMYVSACQPRCPVCRRDASVIGDSGSRYPHYCECSNPRCAVAGFKIDDVGKLLYIWLGKKLDYSLKKEELPTNESKPIGMENVQRHVKIEYKKILADTLETWRNLHSQYRMSEEKSFAEKKALQKLKGWLPEEGEQ
jgi:hypothetical protein